FALEHREEPRRATRIGICRNVLICHMKRFPRRPLISHAPITAFAWLFRTCPHALFVHFLSGVLIQQHIRRKTTSRRTAVNVVALAHPPTIAVCSGVTYPLGIVIRAHPACVDV